MSTRDLGSVGEEVAARFLESKGFKILFKNWTCRWGEIDVIAQDGKVLVFVEVKSRSGGRFESGYGALNYTKKKRLLRAIHKFLLEHNLWEVSWRLDAVCVTEIFGETEIHHYENILVDS